MAPLDSHSESDLRSTDELIELLLSKNSAFESDEEWVLIGRLQQRLPQTLDRIQILRESGLECARDLAVIVLGQNLVREKHQAHRLTQVLIEMLWSETSLRVIESITHALGHLRDPMASDPLVELSRHRDPAIRWAAVSSLCGRDESRCIEALIVCSSDLDRDVRNWATFGLGSMVDVDTEALCQALVARLEDADDEIREEAIVGLARRGDVRVIVPFKSELDRRGIGILRDSPLMQEAAEAIVNPSIIKRGKEWAPLLIRLAQLGIPGQWEGYFV